MTCSTTNHRTEERARRRAESAARELLTGTLVGSAGDLGVLGSERHAAELAIDDAERQAQQIREDASKRAQELVDLARERAAAVEKRYADAWRTARAAGWSPTQLRGMGYRPPSRALARNRRDSADPEHPMSERGTVGTPPKHAGSASISDSSQVDADRVAEASVSAPFEART